MKIAFDIDDVLAQLLPAWLASYNKEHGTHWSEDDLTRWDFQEDLGCTYDDLLKHLLPSLYDTIEPCENALYVVNSLREMGHEPVYISSSHDMETWIAKLNWLQKHGFMSPAKPDPALPIGEWCYYQSKAQVGINLNIPVLVDDHVKNLEDWQGVGFLVTRPHNRRLIWTGKRLRKLTDLINEIAWLEKKLPNPVSNVLQANEAGWIGDNRLVEITGWKELPIGEKPSNPKDIIGSDKIPFHLWPETATIYGTLGMLEGALKYGRNNFRAVGVRASIYIDAARRHINAWASGEDNAEDSGLPHLGHALACLAILVEAIAQENLVDDRDFKGQAYLKLLKKMTPEVKRLKEKYKDRTPKHYTIKD